MAEAQDTLDVSDLKENFLECSVCLEHFDQAERRPRLLVNCLHAFCTQCLEQLLEKEGRGQVTCPNCRQVQQVKGNAQSLPVDPVRNKLVDYVQFKRGKTIPCTDCPDESYAVARCHDCQSYMCVRCKEAHHRNRLSRKHKCQSLEDALSEPVKLFLSHFCKDHPDHKIEFYCEQCSSLCCVSCSIVKHKGHDLDPIEDAANKMMSSLQTKTENIGKSVSVLRKEKTSLEEESSKQELNLKQTTLSLNQTFEKLIAQLKLRQSQLINELKQKTESTINGLKKQREDKEDSIAQMESTIEYFKQMESKSDDCEVLSAGPVLVQSLDAVAAAVSLTQDVQHPTWTFLPGEIDNIISKVHTFGGIHSSTDGHSKSRDLSAARENYQSDSNLDAKGAVGRNLQITSAELKDLECSAFDSTFEENASFMRDLDKAQTEELAVIEKWVEGTKWKPDNLSSYEWGSADSKELLVAGSKKTHPMSYDLIHRASEFAEETRKLKFNLPGGIVVKVYCGDIVKIGTDGIVSGANSKPQRNAGVAGAIERACGKILTREFEGYIRFNGPLKVSEVMHTTSGDLNASGTNYILHTVGPVFLDTLETKFGYLLTCTYQQCLDYAHKKLRIKSIAFPIICTGKHGAPLDLIVEAFLDAMVMYANTQQVHASLKEIHLVDNDLETVQTAIVMIKQHLEHGFEMLVSKAMSRYPRSIKKSTGNDALLKAFSSHRGKR